MRGRITVCAFVIVVFIPWPSFECLALFPAGATDSENLLTALDTFAALEYDAHSAAATACVRKVYD